MRTRILVLVSFWSFCLLASSAMPQRNPSPPIRVDESSARLQLSQHGSIFSMELSAGSLNAIPATFKAKLLAPNDAILSESSIDVQLAAKPLRIELPLSWAPANGLDDVSGTRLCYEVVPGDRWLPSQSGILSAAQIIPNLFELRFVGIDAMTLGHTYVAHVWATRPGSNKPVPGVDLTATFGDEDEVETEKGMKANGRTNLRGEATLTFRLPEAPGGAPDDETVDLEISGSHDNFRNSLTAELHLWRRAGILLSTDKPLYQPEQLLHMRALLLNDSRRAWAGQSVHFLVRDPDDTTVFSSDAQSSRFGIASADWTIPSSQKLGTYKVTAEISGDSNVRELVAQQHVRLSRYELPTFTVNVLPDQPYYLPGQNANLVISAAYMFGKPVLRGRVRLLREASRKWNYADQKWEAEEEVIQEGEFDAQNQFHAALDLSREHARLQNSDWERFEDIRYFVYVTDSSSKRTEERHFDVRISRDALHLYVLNVPTGLAAGLRPEFLVSASFADGTPAHTSIVATLTTLDPADTDTEKKPAPPISVVQVHTNHYGVARIRIPAAVEFSKDHDRIYLALDARTLDGRSGHHLESYEVRDIPLRITPAKTLLRAGEPIEADIESAAPQPRVRVDLIDRDTQSILASQQVNLKHPCAHVTFPPNQQYSGVLTLAAYSLDAQFDRYSAREQVAAASVLIPHPTKLHLDVKPAKATYRPGDSASVALRVRGIEGEASQSALGFMVYDQALEELARTEASRSTGYDDRIEPHMGFVSFPGKDDALAGVSVEDLLNRPPDASVPADLELLARALFSGTAYAPITSDTSDRDPQLAQVFRRQISAAVDPVVRILQDNFTETGHYPENDAELARILAARSNASAAPPRDPWGRPYHVQREFAWTNEVLEISSEGPDKTPGTADDFIATSLQRPFFERDEKRLRTILDAYHARTGNYVRDLAALQSACSLQSTSLDSFVDPWSTPYRFAFNVVRENLGVSVFSAGPGRHFHAPTHEPDDLNVTTLWTPYFQEIHMRINNALVADAKASAHFPENENEFIAVLQRQGIDWNALRDPWNRPYYVLPVVQNSYSDKITVQVYGQNSSGTAAPVTHTVRGFSIMSEGADLTPNTSDDFSLARFTSPFHDELGGASSAQSTAPRKLQPFYSGNTGAIRVSITDATGAAIVNAKVAATDQSTNLTYEAPSNEQGVSLVINLPAGTYRILVESPGFRSYALTNIPVLSSNVTDLDVRLQVGAVSETVEVAASSVQLSTSTSSLLAVAASVVLATKSGAASGKIAPPFATPRLREYFPETLFWQPEILTGRSGQTTVKVPLADSITTWKVSVVASTLDGHVATASTDIRAFLPFFVELDPPKVLTVGDEIHLPVTVRNYLEKPQSVTLEWAAEPWSQTLSPVTSRLDVSAGDYAQRDFSFRAALPMKSAQQRLTAYNRSSQSDSDAIEKKLRVHADGQERITQASSFFTGGTSLTLDIPSSALPGSVEAELVLYPSLIAHVTDSIEAIMERPYGCAEQTISSAYPSLLWLQLQKTRHLPASSLDGRARHYLRLAYAKLLGYREPGGGISYWGKGAPHVSLTAYAVRFLSEASEFIDVDNAVISSARGWLLQQTTPQGGFKEYDWYGKPSTEPPAYLTAYVLEVLARDLERRGSADRDIDVERQTVRKALDYLVGKMPVITDPYDVALLARARLALKQDASSQISTLLAIQHTEGQTSYWDLQHNTVYAGWGFTGRIETTALVIDALAAAKRDAYPAGEIDSTLRRATLFILKHKDRYGVWYSTQATVDVLQALIGQLSVETAGAEKIADATTLRIDGRPGPLLSVSSDLRQLTPRRADLTAFLSPGHHTLTIENGPASPASAYLKASYYLPWTDHAVTSSLVPSGDAESLRYAVKFDRTNAAVSDSIRCNVHAERVGFRGYGMMLAEVGLPPGSDVDRASLDAAVESAGWAIQSYEIQPDRVVFYLWPSAGGTDFSFSLRPRFAMSAASAESILYDYYNPEARASVPPARFVITDAAARTLAVK